MKGKHQRKLRIIVLLQRELMPPETLEGVEDKRETALANRVRRGFNLEGSGT